MKARAPYFIDTNIFLRVLIPEDVQFTAESKQLLLAVKRGDIIGYTSDLVLAEIVWTLRSVYRQSKNTTVQLTDSILNLHGLKVVSGFDVRMALKLYRTTSVKYIDACIAAIPQVSSQEWTLVSYDKDFEKLPVRWQVPGKV